MSQIDQKQLFLEGEGDKLCERNEFDKRDIEEVMETDLVVNALRAANITPTRALELGCSSGYRLECLRRIYGCEGFGVDPSSLAIGYGQEHFPEVTLKVGTAEEVPFDGLFDLVIFCGSLYLCDRHDLFAIAAEADRVTGDKGAIVLLDFHPPQPYKNAYSHREGYFSYKLDHSSMFTWSPTYRLVYRTTMHHMTREVGRYDDIDNLQSISIVYKDVESAYPLNPYAS